jgi:cell wall-associated NlpC family hydrolase
MKRDKEEFKAKNREESFIKDKRPDIQLGRHAENPQESQQVSQSKKNRMYQARQEYTEPVTLTAETPDKADSEMDFTEQEYLPENPQEQPDNDAQPEQTQEDFSELADSGKQDRNADIPKSEPPKQTATQKNRLYQKHTKAAQKPVDLDISQIETEREPAGTNEPPQTKADEYNIRDAVQDNKTEFERNTDVDFSEMSADKDSNIPFDRVQTSGNDSAEQKSQGKGKRQRLVYDKSEKQPDGSSGTKAEQAGTDGNNTLSGQPEGKAEKSEQAPSGGVPFDRVAKFEQKAEKARAKADKAEQDLPHKTKIKRKRLYDEQKQQTKTRLQFEKEVKPQSDLYHRSPLAPMKTAVSLSGQKALGELHGKIAEAEHENTAVEAAHKTEQKAETLAHYSVRTAKYINGQRKNAPYQKAARLQHKAEKAEIKAIHEKTLAENPQLKKSMLKKFQQKQRIKKQYQKAKRAEQSAKAAKKTAQNTERAARRFIAFVWRHKAIFGVILAVALLIAWLGTVLSSCSVMLTTGTNSLMVSSYFAEDEDIYAAEEYYVSLEQDLQARINRIESDYPRYDEYQYNMAQVGHNPYELISYLTAVYMDFQFDDIQGGLDELFNSQYHLRITETTEQRTDEDGNAYEYKILNVTLTNNGFTQALTADQRELYYIYLESKGNRDYLFADDIYANESESPGYMIPGEALTDETFRKLITEAEKYLGYPYVWGGSTPQTSFDCSGFVCWVFRNSGVYPLSRTTAQGIYDQCARISPQGAKPGDIIFFKGTYNTSEVSHVGIYVGNGMMIHCGSPIQYTSVNTNYWQSHFFAYGRLGGN